MRILFEKLLEFLRSFWRRPAPHQETIAELAYKTEPVIMKIDADPMECFENILLDDKVHV